MVPVVDMSVVVVQVGGGIGLAAGSIQALAVVGDRSRGNNPTTTWSRCIRG